MAQNSRGIPGCGTQSSGGAGLSPCLDSVSSEGFSKLSNSMTWDVLIRPPLEKLQVLDVTWEEFHEIQWLLPKSSLFLPLE